MTGCLYAGLPRWFSDKESPCHCRRRLSVGSILGQEDPLEEEMVTHSSILAWRIPWTEEPGGLQSDVVARIGHDLATESPPPPCSCYHFVNCFGLAPFCSLLFEGKKLLLFPPFFCSLLLWFFWLTLVLCLDSFFFFVCVPTVDFWFALTMRFWCSSI